MRASRTRATRAAAAAAPAADPMDVGAAPVAPRDLDAEVGVAAAALVAMAVATPPPPPPPPCRCADYAEMHEENARLKLLLADAHATNARLRERAIDEGIPMHLVERVRGHARILHAHAASNSNSSNGSH